MFRIEEIKKSKMQIVQYIERRRYIKYLRRGGKTVKKKYQECKEIRGENVYVD